MIIKPDINDDIKQLIFENTTKKIKQQIVHIIIIEYMIDMLSLLEDLKKSDYCPYTSII